jgi:hypothetical protein
MSAPRLKLGVTRMKSARCVVATESEAQMTSKRITLLVVCLAALFGMASQEIDPWLGKWEFVESWPTIDRSGLEVVQYELILRREGRKLIADLDMDGHMTPDLRTWPWSLTAQAIDYTGVKAKLPGCMVRKRNDTRFWPVWRVTAGFSAKSDCAPLLCRSKMYHDIVTPCPEVRTLRRIRADCAPVGNGITVVFSESRQDDQNWSHFVKGDVLFRLERSQKGILTVWRTLRPTLPEHDKAGIYFKRTSERAG